jgi:hypothetical protein
MSWDLAWKGLEYLPTTEVTYDAVGNFGLAPVGRLCRNCSSVFNLYVFSCLCLLCLVMWHLVQLVMCIIRGCGQHQLGQILGSGLTNLLFEVASFTALLGQVYSYCWLLGNENWLTDYG